MVKSQLSFPLKDYKFDEQDVNCDTEVICLQRRMESADEWYWFVLHIRSQFSSTFWPKMHRCYRGSIY